MMRTWHWLQFAVFTALGVAFGIGTFTFIYARGGSYLSDDSRACINCHVMNDAYTSWSRSSHQAVAACNACHIPHDFAEKWLAKARNGVKHSIAFTLQSFREPIRITEANRRLLQQNCVECHAMVVSEIVQHGKLQRYCFECHRGLGHGP